jgi:hypothetical protein
MTTNIDQLVSTDNCLLICGLNSLARTAGSSLASALGGTVLTAQTIMLGKTLDRRRSQVLCLYLTGNRPARTARDMIAS